MLRTLSGALAAASFLLLGLGAPAEAASLGLSVNPAVGFSQSGAIEISDDAGGLSVVNGFGASLEGFGLPGLTDNVFDLLVTGDSLSAPAPAALLFVDGADGSLAGELVDFAVMATFVELLFAITQDDFGLFGAQALMVVTGDFSAGLATTGASVTINPVVEPIPLPATLPLLAGALLVVAALRRRGA